MSLRILGCQLNLTLGQLVTDQNSYLLTVMCQATRYPAALPLQTITTKAVVKALTQYISTFGIPKVIQSDPTQNLIDHVNGFRFKLYRAGERARKRLECSQKKMKHKYDRKA